MAAAIRNSNLLVFVVATFLAIDAALVVASQPRVVAGRPIATAARSSLTIEFGEPCPVTGVTVPLQHAQRSDDFAKMFEAIVRDEYAAINTRKLAGELADLQAQLQTELAFISGHFIEAPALVAPLTRADKLDHRSGQSNTE